MTEILMPAEYAHCIFTFGSNLSGVHGAGAAKTAHLHYGAKLGMGIGLCGQSYAIPTKDHKIQTLPLETIAGHVQVFLTHASANPGVQYYVTPIGCGLAGYSHHQIAPLFTHAPLNCILPVQWQPWIQGD